MRSKNFCTKRLEHFIIANYGAREYGTNLHAIANSKLLIVINDVPAIILSINCCDCAKIKQANTFSTCILFYFHKSGNVRL